MRARTRNLFLVLKMERRQCTEDPEFLLLFHLQLIRSRLIAEINGGASEDETEQDHSGDGHLAQCDLAKEESCAPQATSRCKSKRGEEMNVPLEHSFRL